MLALGGRAARLAHACLSPAMPDEPAFAGRDAHDGRRLDGRGRAARASPPPSMSSPTNSRTCRLRRGRHSCAERRRCAPAPLALAKTQDRLVEKTFLRDLGIATAPFVAVDDAGALARVIAQIGRPSILKTRRFGYDGKGQITLRDGSDIGAGVSHAAAAQPAILEGLVPFDREISVVAARGWDGAFRAYDICENASCQPAFSHVTRAPAAVDAKTARRCGRRSRKRIADALDYVGVLAVEMFVVSRENGEARRRQRDRAARAQFRALDARRRGHIAVRAAYPRRRRLAARFDAAARPHVEMRNLIGHDAVRWRDSRGAGRRLPASLRKGRSACRPQDGPCHARSRELD